MSGKSRRASTEISLSGTLLDGYSGRIEMYTRSRSWWKKLLRLRAKPHSLYANVSGSKMRAWRP